MPPKRKTEQEEAPKGPDEAEIRQMALVASTFANVELENKTKTLRALEALYQKEREENARLNQEKQETERDNIDVVNVLRNDIESHKDQLAEQRKQFNEEISRLKKNIKFLNEEIADLKSSHEEKLEECNQEIKSLEADLNAMNAFKEERSRIYMELEMFKSNHHEVVEKYEKEISKQRFVALEEKVRLKGEERLMKEKIEREVEERARRLLEPKTKQIDQQNMALLEEKREREHEISKLVTENKRLTNQVAELKREQELATSADTEHIKRAVGKARENKDLRVKVDQLEDRIAQLLQSHNQAMSSQRQGEDKRVSQLTVDRDNALRSAEILQKDLVKVRQMAKTIVKQRTDLEVFFNEALDYVRNQINAERRGIAPPTQETPKQITAGSGSMKASNNTKRGDKRDHQFFQGRFENVLTSGSQRSQPGPGTASSLPAIGSQGRNPGSLNSTMPLPPGSGGDAALVPSATSQNRQQQQSFQDPTAFARVDISELSWSDKERVLRILLAKINATNQARGQRKEPVISSSTTGAAAITLPAIDGGRPSPPSTPSDSAFLTQQQQQPAAL